MEEIVGERMEGGDMHEKLKSGVFLCKLINKLAPSSVRKVNDSKMAFKQMENIGNFLSGVSAYGVPANESFQTVDLYENQNMRQVLICIQSLGRHAQKNSFDGPTLGPKMSDKNERSFDKDTLDAGKYVASQQMGNNKGATQAGMSPYGKSREVTMDSNP